jgi:hypothetical protein
LASAALRVSLGPTAGQFRTPYSCVVI